MPDNKTVPVLQRLDNLEANVQNQKNELEELYNSFKGSFFSLIETLEGLLEALGEDAQKKTQEAINAKRLKRLQAKAEQEKVQLKQLVDAGVLVPSDKVAENTVIVGRTMDTDNNLIGAGRSQVDFNSLDENVKGKFLGQSLGFVYETEDHKKFEIVELYDLVSEQKQEPTPLEEALPAKE